MQTSILNRRVAAVVVFLLGGRLLLSCIAFEQLEQEYREEDDTLWHAGSRRYSRAGSKEGAINTYNT